MSMLKGKYALVTGGAQGIGLACVKELLVNGIEGVTLVDINEVRGEESTALLKKEFGTEKLIFVAADVSKKDQVEGAFKKSIEHWKHLDVVINNAGLLGEQDWKPTLSTNCDGMLHGTLFGLEYMSTKQNGRGGVIVNMGSINGVYPNATLPVYSATKAFTVMLGRCFGDPIYYDHNGVKVLTICPGRTITEMVHNAPNLIASKSLCPNIQTVFQNRLMNLKPQTPEELAKQILEVMIRGGSGTAWVIAGNEATQHNNLRFSSIQIISYDLVYLVYDKMSMLKGKYALVTGGAQGIGLACVKELLVNGIEGVTLVDINEVRGEESTALLKKEFGTQKVIFVAADVSKKDQVEDAFKKSAEHWKRLDIVINNAGTLAEQDWESTLSTNCGGVLHGTLAGLEYMSKKQNGRGGIVVNMGSIAGVHPEIAMPVYSASKAFTVMLGRCFGDPIYYDHNGVTVLTICPGKTFTELQSNSPNLIASERLCPIIKEFYRTCDAAFISQTPEELAKLILEVMVRGNSGTVWIIAGNEATQVDFSATDRQGNV
ncbi:uncharacterized protein LOC116180023 [Photinus pyralis]|uniref:uncharacterized protein LOC116180023 n=1 Tax=Photinus pyralis TaxID=7054 RepID=UPI0012677DB0|nr:uncharacterized protein LOC116180023 [Photinus pyralis]